MSIILQRVPSYTFVSVFNVLAMFIFKVSVEYHINFISKWGFTQFQRGVLSTS